MRQSLLLIAGSAAALSSAARASETITYSYDAHGRLVAVVHTGTVNSGVSTTYAFDKADNRISASTTGATSLSSASSPLQNPELLTSDASASVEEESTGSGEMSETPAASGSEEQQLTSPEELPPPPS